MFTMKINMFIYLLILNTKQINLAKLFQLHIFTQVIKIIIRISLYKNLFSMKRISQQLLVNLNQLISHIRAVKINLIMNYLKIYSQVKYHSSGQQIIHKYNLRLGLKTINRLMRLVLSLNVNKLQSIKEFYVWVIRY